MKFASHIFYFTINGILSTSRITRDYLGIHSIKNNAFNPFVVSPHEVIVLIFQWYHSANWNQFLNSGSTLSLVTTKFRQLVVHWPVGISLSLVFSLPSSHAKNILAHKFIWRMNTSSGSIRDTNTLKLPKPLNVTKIDISLTAIYHDRRNQRDLPHWNTFLSQFFPS